jgi:alginate O-acetyltransferase complex protein AlgI
MPFNSLAYLLLLFTANQLVRRTAMPVLVLLVANVTFYLAAGLFDFAIFATALIVNWAIQVFLPADRIRIVVAVVVNICLLGYFKYLGLFVGDSGVSGSYVDTMLPLGISFYSFQIIAYHIDVCRGRAKPATGIATFAVFIGLFPQLVAGPIVRAQLLLPQVERLLRGEMRRHRIITYGLAFCVLGLFKKIVLADSLAPFVNEAFSGVPLSTTLAWFGATLFSFQIYFDFSGYSDIAIGSAYLLGFRLPLNFLTPYVSLGPRDFWRRWHISLSTWIRDYLYIPLGGNRGGSVRIALVLLGVMSVAGLWHGANYTFIVWGFGWGLYIWASRLFPTVLGLPKSLRWLIHMSIVILLWVLFRSPDLDFAGSYIGVMFGSAAIGIGDVSPLAALGVAALFVLHFVESRLHQLSMVRYWRHWNHPRAWGFLVCTAFLLVMIPLHTESPFIYFRF